MAKESLSLCTLDDIIMHRNICNYKSLYIGWLLTVLGHVFIYIGSIVAIVMAIVHQPWYLSCIFTLFFFSPALAGFFCMLTNLENYFRIRLGWEVIPDDYASFYFRKWRQKGEPQYIIFKGD